MFLPCNDSWYCKSKIVINVIYSAVVSQYGEPVQYGLNANLEICDCRLK